MTLFVVTSIVLIPLSSGAVHISEIRIDTAAAIPTSSRAGGPAGRIPDGLTYLVIGDGASGSGTIENVTDLSGLSLEADGYLAVHKSGTTPVCTGYDLDMVLNFENNDNVTHMLVSGFSGADGDLLDTDQDGVLDVTPWSSIVDDVALIDEIGGGDLVYSSNTVGPDGAYVPGLVLLCNGIWSFGSFDLCVHDSAGAANSACAVDNETSSFSRLKAGYR